MYILFSISFLNWYGITILESLKIRSLFIVSSPLYLAYGFMESLNFLWFFGQPSRIILFKSVKSLSLCVSKIISYNFSFVTFSSDTTKQTCACILLSKFSPACSLMYARDNISAIINCFPGLYFNSILYFWICNNIRCNLGGHF